MPGTIKKGETNSPFFCFLFLPVYDNLSITLWDLFVLVTIQAKNESSCRQDNLLIHRFSKYTTAPLII